MIIKIHIKTHPHVVLWFVTFSFSSFSVLNTYIDTHIHTHTSITVQNTLIFRYMSLRWSIVKVKFNFKFKIK